MYGSVGELIGPTLLFQKAEVLFDLLEVNFDGPAEGVDLQDFGVAQGHIRAEEDDPGVGRLGTNRCAKDQAQAIGSSMDRWREFLPKRRYPYLKCPVQWTPRAEPQ